jgi:hypothetical protein
MARHAPCQEARSLIAFAAGAACCRQTEGRRAVHARSRQHARCAAKWGARRREAHSVNVVAARAARCRLKAAALGAAARAADPRTPAGGRGVRACARARSDTLACTGALGEQPGPAGGCNVRQPVLSLQWSCMLSVTLFRTRHIQGLRKGRAVETCGGAEVRA